MALKHHFPSSLDTVLKALKGDIPKEESDFQSYSNHDKNVAVDFITEWSTAAPTGTEIITKAEKTRGICHGHHHSRAETTTAQHSGGPCSSTSWNLGSKLIHGIWGLQPCHPRRSTRQNSVANSHAEGESQGQSHAIGETHAHGGGQTHAQGGGQTHTQGGGQTHGGENPFGGGQAHSGGQVLGGGEIPVGGPQQMALMFEMIKGMQQNQVELAESLRQLREANGNKEDHQNKNDNRNHEERESHNKNDTPFVTMSDVADLLRQERERPPKEPRHFVRRPPYPIELLKEPYPEKYDTPVFALFDGRKGSAMEHISKAYTWYTVLPAGSIRTWEDMVESFCSKYFHVEEKITLVNLHSTKQQIGEDLVKYIHRFRGRVLGLSCEVSRGGASRVKPQVEKSRDKKSLPQTLTVSTATAPSGTKRKNPTDKAYEEPPPLPFTAEEMMAIFDKWVQDQVNRKIQDGTLQLSEAQQKVHQIPFPNYNKDKGKAVVSVVIHGNVSDMEAEESAAASSSLIPAAVKDSTKESKVQVRRALVDTGSCLKPHSFKHSPSRKGATAEDPRLSHGGDPDLEGMTEHTMGHVQLVLKVGPIVALTRFHVGRLNGKPIRIAANSCPFDQTEAHFVEAALYDDLASTGEPSIVRPCGTPLPAWEDIKDDPEIDLRELLERKKKRKEREVESRESTTMRACPTPRWTHCLSLMKTENSGKVVVDQLQSTAMSSEEVTGRPCTVYRVHSSECQRSFGGSNRVYRDGSWSIYDGPCIVHDVFAWDYHEMPGIDPGLVAHSLNVEPGTRPVVQPMRTFHTEVEAQITQEVKKLLAAGFIKPIQHPQIQPLVTPCSSFMDGFSGYNQIRMSTRDAEKTAFRTPIDYVDDIVVKSKRREDHLGILRKVFDRCRLYKLKMNPLKCAFGVSAGKFLGFLVHNRGIDVDPAKASAIATMKAPTSHKELKSFLGRLSYIRRFIPGLAAVTATFMPLMKKGIPFVWSTACQQAFEKIQLIMTKLPTVCAPVPGRPLRLYLASNNEAIGGLVAQEDEDGTEKANLLYLLAQFPGEDSSLISHEVPGEIGEALLAEDGETIAKSFKLDFSCSNNASEYEAYITGLVIAHEMGIKHLRVIGDSNPYHLPDQGCENRYADALATLGSQVSFEGSKVDVTIDKRSMPITDLLREKFKEQNLDAEDWRTPIRAKLVSPEGVADLKMLKDYVLIAGDLYRRLPGGVLARCVNLQEAAKKLTEVHERCCELRDGHESDQIYATFVSSDWRTPFLEYLIENILPQTSQAAIRLKKLATRYFVEGGILFRKGFHGDPLRCLSLAESQTKDTADFVKSCHTCQLQANLIHTHPTSLQNMATPWPFHTWGLDLIGPINPSSGGYIWILVATEYFSKWVEAIPLRKATGAAVANFIPRTHYHKHRRSTPYYPQGNGQAEATNRMLLRILSKMVFDYGKGWNSHLADTLWAYRGSTKTATGFTPFSLVYGTDAISPTELLVPSPRILHGMDLEADADICARSKSGRPGRIFAKGQMVLRAVDHVRRGLPSPSKFAPNWEGPYLIREAYDSGYYKLSTADGTTLVDPINGKWLKRYYS
uniref:Uncharacterized protein n=1 Tax=Fagus sylvatica TaxID=28930 RepID=A0A2N9EQI3_FAGSY